MEKNRSRIVAFVEGFVATYPESDIRDIYKVLYQAFHGPEHAVTNREKAREWLLSEWTGLDLRSVSKDAPLVEARFVEGVTPPLWAIHLLPAKRAGIDPELILEEFLRASEEFPKAYPSPDINLHQAFVEAWRKLDFPRDEFAAFSGEVEKQKWPAMHHSERFREAYGPHYRLVMDPSTFDHLFYGKM
jgi:hypothetical protein